MPKHLATFSFADEPELGTKGMVVTVKVDGDIIGHLMIGKAHLTWFEKNKKKKGHKASWKDLRGWMTKSFKEGTATRPQSFGNGAQIQEAVNESVVGLLVAWRT